MKKQILSALLCIISFSTFAQNTLNFQEILDKVPSKPVGLKQIKQKLGYEPQQRNIGNRKEYYFSKNGLSFELMDDLETISDIIFYPKVCAESLKKPFFFKQNLTLNDVNQYQSSPYYIRWNKTNKKLSLGYQDAIENKFIYEVTLEEDVFTEAAVAYSSFVNQLKKIGNKTIDIVKIDLNGLKMPSGYITPPMPSPPLSSSSEKQKVIEPFINEVKTDSVGNKFWKIGGGGDQTYYDMITDDLGDVYVAIYFEKEAICGNKKFIAKGRNDILISKYSSESEFLWATQIQVNSESPLAENVKLCIDKNRNLYFSGLCNSPMKVDNMVIGQSDYNIFAIKFDLNGKAVWKREVNSEHYMTHLANAEVDDDGNLNILYNFQKSVVIGKDTIKSERGNTIGFIKYDSEGQILLSKSLAKTEYGYSTFINKKGNVILLVKTINDIIVDNKYSIEGSDMNLQILKFDKNGKLFFQKYFQFLGCKFPTLLEDKKGNLIINGASIYPIKVNNQIFETDSQDTFFFIKLDNLANFQYLKQISAKEHRYFFNKIYLDDEDNIYFFGNSEGLVKTDSKSLVATSSNKRTVYIKYDETGKVREMKQFSEGLNDKSGSSNLGKMIVDKDVFMVLGMFNSPQNIGYTTIKPDNGYDVFLGKYDIKNDFLLDKTASKAISKEIIDRNKVTNTNGDIIKKSFGGGINFAKDVVFDKSGNKYIYGTCKNTMEVANFKYSSQTSEFFVAKFGKNDSLKWFKTIKSKMPTIMFYDAGSLKIDNEGSLYISGTIGGEYFADNLKVISNEYSKKDVVSCYFLCKIKNNGEFEWFKNTGIEGRFIINNYNFFELDSQGNIYFAGKFPSEMTNQNFPINQVGEADYFIAKFNNNGKQTWFKVLGSESDDIINDIEIDKNDNIYLVGSVGKNVFFDKQKMTFQNSKNAFVARINSSGMLLEMKITLPNSINKKIKIINTNEFVLLGNFTESVNYKGGILTSEGSQDAFVGVFDKTLNPKWIKSFGSAGYEKGEEVELDNFGNIFTSVYLDRKGIVINKYSNKGLLEWSKSIDAENTYISGGMKYDNNGYICLVGAFQKKMCLNNNCFYSSGYQDLFWTSFKAK